MSSHTRHTSTSSLPHRTSNSSSTPSAIPTNPTVAEVPEPDETGSRSPAAANTPAAAASQSQPRSRSQSQSQSAQTFSASAETAIRYQPQGRSRQEQESSIHDVVRRIVKPGSILFQHQPPPVVTQQRSERLQQTVQQPVSNMDRRHPSSFQQLEKLGEGTYATVSQYT